jgi:hypothetical protein
MTTAAPIPKPLVARRNAVMVDNIESLSTLAAPELAASCPQNLNVGR